MATISVVPCVRTLLPLYRTQFEYICEFSSQRSCVWASKWGPRPNLGISVHSDAGEMKTFSSFQKNLLFGVVASTIFGFYLVVVGSQFLGVKGILMNVVVVPVVMGIAIAGVVRANRQLTMTVAAAIPLVPAFIVGVEQHKIYVNVIYAVVLSFVFMFGAAIGMSLKDIVKKVHEPGGS